MKGTERRADKWYTALGVRQTEIDSIATLRPDLLDGLVRDAIAPFYITRRCVGGPRRSNVSGSGRPSRR